MPERTIQELPRLPAMLPGLVRAASRRGRQPGAALPEVRLRVSALASDPDRLDAYRRVVGLPPDEHLPLTYPQVLAAPLHVALMARRDFPHPVLGVVHVRNDIEQTMAVPARASFALSARFETQREVTSGVELDLVTELELGERVVWRATTTMLRRAGRARRGGREEVERESDPLASVPGRRWVVPADTGRRYAGVSGDVNPVHLSALTARFFGFRRAIAHGMWTLARCLAELGAPTPEEEVQLSCRFQRPLFLGTEVEFRARVSDGATDFRVSSPDGTPHLTGRLGARRAVRGEGREPGGDARGVHPAAR